MSAYNNAVAGNCSVKRLNHIEIIESKRLLFTQAVDRRIFEYTPRTATSASRGQWWIENFNTGTAKRCQDTEHNDTHYVMLRAVVLSTVCTECCLVECRYSDCRYVECRGSKVKYLKKIYLCFFSSDSSCTGDEVIQHFFSRRTLWQNKPEFLLLTSNFNLVYLGVLHRAYLKRGCSTLVGSYI